MSPSVKRPRGSAPGDGRSSRWDGHRESRRAEFVAAAARAIESHGPDVHLADIAAEAGVSKPVLYRYFSDKDDLLGATAQWVADRILTVITEVLAADLPPRRLVEEAVAAYLTEVDEHRNLFLVAVRPHGQALDGSVAGSRSAIATVLASTLGKALRDAGADVRGAEPWAHSLVGLGASAAQWWVERQTMSREDLADYLSAFIWHALDGISHEQLAAARHHLVHPGATP